MMDCIPHGQVPHVADAKVLAKRHDPVVQMQSVVAPNVQAVA